MSLMFPNASRSYDATRRAVRFWGYDTAMEWSFFVTAEALRRMQPALVEDEAGMLGAFDAHRDAIRATAARLFALGRKGSYEIGAAEV
jgi:hypothetical protein